MGTWVTWVRGLCGSNFYVGYMSYVGQNIFYVGQHFTWVIIFMWVAWVKYFCVGLCMGQNFLRESKIFVWVKFFFFSLVNFYLLEEIILLYYN